MKGKKACFQTEPWERDGGGDFKGESKLKNTNEKIKTGIDIINRKALALKKDDWPKLSDQLRDLRKYMHDFEYWLDNEIRIEKEAKAKQKVQAIVDAGFEFDRIIVDKTRFVVSDGKIIIGHNFSEDDGIPF